MEIDFNAKVQVREGREDCEYAQSLGGTIKSCTYLGPCFSKQSFGYSGLCKFGLFDNWTGPVESSLDAVVKGDETNHK